MLFGIAVLAFVSLGLPDGVLGVAWPSMRRTFALPLSQLGLLLAAAMVGYLASTFSSGVLVARMGVGRLLVWSTVAMVASSLGYALAPAWAIVVLWATVTGLGAGAIDAGINAFAAARFSPRRVNWLHASYGIGAMLGPLLMTAVLSSGLTWRVGYGIIGVALSGTALCFLRTLDRWSLGSASDPDAPAEGRSAGLGATLRLPRVWGNVALFFVYTGLEVTGGQWIYSLLTEARGVPPAWAGVAVGGYWGSLTAGRLVAGALTRRLSVETLLRAGMIGALGGALVIWLGRGMAVSVAGPALLGFALAPIFPLLISSTPGRVGARHASHAIGLQVGAAYLGTAALPGVAGILARQVGLEVVGPFLLVTALAVLALHEAGRGASSRAGGAGVSRAPSPAVPAPGGPSTTLPSP